MKGKLVNVYFQHADALLGVLVEHEPCGVGDSWALLDRDGRCHRALLFERIDECAPSEEESASNSGGVARGQGTANTARDAICALDLVECPHSVSGVVKLSCIYAGECPHKQHP